MKKQNPLIQQDSFFDSKTEIFNTSSDLKIHRHLGEELENPKINFLLAQDLVEHRIKKLQEMLYTYVDNFESDKKRHNEINNEAQLHLDTFEKDMYFRIKGNFETLADDINEQKSLNLLNQKQITNLKKEKNENMLEMNKLHSRLDNIEKVLGINLKEKREKIERRNLNL